MSGGYSALSTKGVASMLSFTLWRAFTAPVTFALLAVLICTAVMQVKYVNKALQRFDSTQVIPVQFVMFTLSVIIGSAILYRDFEKADTSSMFKFVWGCLLTFFGVYLITSGRAQNNEEDDEETDEEGEERIGLADQDRNEAFPRTPVFNRQGVIVGAVDGTNDDDTPSPSRRSSRASVTFVEPSRPRNPRMYSDSSVRGSVRNSSEETPLLINPWKNSSDDLFQVARHPGIQSSNSSPVLPSEVQTTDSPKPPTNRSSTHDNMHTHPNLQHSPAIPQAEPVRPYTPVRHSISRMMPGPLFSPLSGGLSVIVADSLRRGIETPIRIKRIRKSKSVSNRQNTASEETLGDSETDTEVSRSLEPERSSWSRVTRARSMSNTLGEFLKGKRQRSDTTDGEAGPSGV